MRIEKIYSRDRIKLPQLFSNNRNYSNNIFVNIVIVIVVAVFTYSIIVKAINPIIEEQCKDNAKNIASKIANEQASIIMNNYKYEDIITIVRDSNGNIKMLQTNIKSVNELTSDIPLKIIEEFKKENNSNISIYLGSILGLKMLSATGPKMHVKIANIGNVDTTLESQFTAQGINQTLHRIYLSLDCEATILTPYSTIKQKITNQILIAESVIVGNVPDSYYNIQSTDPVGDSKSLID